MGRKSHVTKPGTIGRSGRTVARTIGRGAIWATLGLLLLRGLTSVVSPPESGKAVAITGSDPSATQGLDAFAVDFARAYLSDPSAESLDPYLSEGSRIGTGIPEDEESADVAQAEVSHTEERGGGEAVLTVACRLRDSRTLYLAVPVVRSEAGEVAATGAPWFVAAPGRPEVDEFDHPQTLAGSEGPAIESLVAKFLPAYLVSGEAEELAYLSLPGVVIEPLAGQVALKSLATVSQLGDGEGPRRTIVAEARVTDPSGGATYPLAYRLSVERVGADHRWYVAAVEGVSA